MQLLKKIIPLLILLLLLSFDTPTKKIVIVIDSGHGGYDTGAIGKHFNTYEKDVNFGVALNLYYLLKDNSKFNPILIKKNDRYISLKKRAQVSNYFNPDLFLSIHCNQPGTKTNTHSRGCEVYYLKDNKVENLNNQRKSVIISHKILEGLQKSLNFENRKVKSSNFSVLRNTNKISPSILIEVAFLSNFDDENYIKETKNQKVIALSIYKNLKNYYQ